MDDIGMHRADSEGSSRTLAGLCPECMLLSALDPDPDTPQPAGPGSLLYSDFFAPDALPGTAGGCRFPPAAYQKGSVGGL